MIEFRDLTEQEIDCRVQSSGEQKNKDTLWARVLLYKDARVDMNLLDEVIGQENWQRDHKELKGNMYCGIGINVNYTDKTKEPLWVWKWDCGAESMTDKEKGESSDSFKRSAVCWGLGRELYTKIPIMIYGLPKNDKGKVAGNFVVEKIKIENKEITALSLMFKANGSDDYLRCFVWTKQDGVKLCNYNLPTTNGISYKGN